MESQNADPGDATSDDASRPLGVSDLDKTLLDFESRHPGHTARKEHLILTELGTSPARYYQRLTLLTKSRSALEYAPQVIHRLESERESRRNGRVAL